MPKTVLITFFKNYLLWDTLGNADGEGNFGFDCVHDGGGGEGWRDVDDGGIGLDVGGGVGNRVENGQTEMLLAALLRGHTTDNVSSVGEGTLSMESTLLSSETLHQKLKRFVIRRFILSTD